MFDDHEDEATDLGEHRPDSATVHCPYCAEAVDISLDGGGGALQQYVEDCAVCCQPWNVTVRYSMNGVVEVSVTAQDD